MTANRPITNQDTMLIPKGQRLIHRKGGIMNIGDYDSFGETGKQYTGMVIPGLSREEPKVNRTVPVFITEEMGETYRKRAAHLAMTKEMVAFDAGVSVITIYKWFSGDIGTTKESHLKLLTALKLSK